MTDHSYGWGDSQEQRLFEGAGEDWPGEPKEGDHGTCGVCGEEIVMKSITSPLVSKGLIPELVWKHDGRTGFLADHHHRAVLAGPA